MSEQECESEAGFELLSFSLKLSFFHSCNTFISCEELSAASSIPEDSVAPVIPHLQGWESYLGNVIGYVLSNVTISMM